MTRLATAVRTIPVRDALADGVRQAQTVAEQYGADAFVVGLPANMDGTEGPQAALSRRFGDALARVSGKPVHYSDERLSSVTARELLGPAALTRKKQKAVRDAVAAQVILQGFLDALPEDGTPIR